MSETVAEQGAVLGRSKAARSVVARDFKRPRRLGQARLAKLQLVLKNLMPALEKKLVEVSGMRVGLTLEGLGEVDADAVFQGASEPLCVLRFRCSKAPAWLVWDPAAAVEVVETILGTRAAAGVARKLTAIEARIAAQLLVEVARMVTVAIELQAADFGLVQVTSELGNWRDPGADAEPHRLEVVLRLHRGEKTSDLRLYLPGIADESEARAVESVPAALPAHLERVEVELCANLPGCEISLDQLLALEEGDVIPLDARLGDPTTLSVEGLALARARLGSHHGRLAVRIESIDVQSIPVA